MWSYLNSTLSFTKEMNCSNRLTITQMFARGTGTTAGGAVCFPSEINVPVQLQSAKQEATITPGGYIIADLDGVVFLPGDLAEKVLEVIPSIVAADERCAGAIRGGMTVKEAFATYRGK